MKIRTKIDSLCDRVSHSIKTSSSVLMVITGILSTPVMAAPTSTMPVITNPTSVMVGNGIVIQVPRAPTFVLWQLDTVGGGQINSYVIQTAKDKKVIVIDGGMSADTNSCGDTRCLRGLLNSLGNHVDMWFVSHMHRDHASALAELLKNPQGSNSQRVISIDRVYASMLNDERLCLDGVANTGSGNPICDSGTVNQATVYGNITSYDWLPEGGELQTNANWDKDTTNTATNNVINKLPLVTSQDLGQEPDVKFYRNFKKVFNDFSVISGDGQYIKQINEVTPGEVIEIDGVTIKILSAKNPNLTVHKGNIVNDSSLVMKFSDAYKSILFTGDLGMDGGCKLLNGTVAVDESVPHRYICTPGSYDSTLLKADYVQMAHHGSWGVDEEFYKAVNAANCLWPAPHQVYYDPGCTPTIPGDYSTCPSGTLTAKTVRDWTEKLCGNTYVMFAEVDRPNGQPSRFNPASPSSSTLADLAFLNSYGLKRIE